MNARSGTYITSSMPGWSAHICGMNQERTGVLDNDWTPPWLEVNPDDLPSWLKFDNPVSPVTGPDYPMPCNFQVKQNIYSRSVR